METPNKADTYSKTRVFEFPNMIARVYFPDLTPGERERRMKAVHDAAANLLRNNMRGMQECQEIAN